MTLPVSDSDFLNLLLLIISSANSESESYHRAPSAPHAYYVLDFYSEQVHYFNVIPTK